jgi:hypothetical protein
MADASILLTGVMGLPAGGLAAAGKDCEGASLPGV